MSLDESLALRTAASRLVGEFAGVFGAETIERFLHPSFDQFAPLMVITMGCGDACPIFPGNVTRNGFSTTPPGGTCPASGPSGTRSNAGSGTCCRYWNSRLPRSVGRAHGEVVGERPVPGGTGPAGRVTHRHRPAGITRAHPRPIGERGPDPAGDACHDDTPATVGLTARTIAPCIPGAASWVNTTSGSVKPAAVNPSRYSDLDRAPAMHPT